MTTGHGTGGSGGSSETGAIREVTPRRERWDVGATVFGGVVALALVAVHVVGTLAAGGVPSVVGRIAGPAAVAEGAAVSADALSPVTAGFLWGAFAAEVAALAALAVLVVVIAVRCLRGRFFDAGTVRLLWATSWVALGYLLVVSLVVTLGTNLALRDLDLAWRDLDAMDWRWFVLLYLFMMFVSLMAVAFRRAAAMSRDQEGLI